MSPCYACFLALGLQKHACRHCCHGSRPAPLLLLPARCDARVPLLMHTCRALPRTALLLPRCAAALPLCKHSTLCTCSSRAVRGAYMVLERQRAADLGYRSPIHDSKEDTHANYDA